MTAAFFGKFETERRIRKGLAQKEFCDQTFLKLLRLLFFVFYKIDVFCAK